MKISSKTHGIIDYIVVVFLWLAPTLFSLPETTATFTYILGGIHLVLTLFTNFKMGAVKVIPLNVHSWIELLVSLALIGLAFYFGRTDGETARNFYIIFGIAVFFTWLITDYTYTTGNK